MSVRACACLAPRAAQVVGYVALSRVAEWPPETAIVRLRFGNDWRCARLDRTRPVEVEGQLLRDAVPSDEMDCPECAAGPPAPAPEAAREPAVCSGSAAVQAAAISVRGTRLVVVLVRREVIDDVAEAALVHGAMQSRFGGTAVVLMGQDEDGTPHFHGDASLLALLEGLPIERMPWKTYPAP